MRPDRRFGLALGFTLIEILVALAIFGIMSAIGYRGLTAVLEARVHLGAYNDKWRDTSLFFARFERDLASIAPRPVKDVTGRTTPAFIGQKIAIGDNAAQIEFTRSGWTSGDSAADDLQRLGYRLRDQHIEVLIWPVLDQAPRSAPAAYTVLDAVKAFEIRYLDENGQWLSSWTNLARPPEAVEASLTLLSGERVTRLVALS